MHLEVAQRERKPTIDSDKGGSSPASLSTSHSSIPRRVQYFLELGGSGTSTAEDVRFAVYIRP